MKDVVFIGSADEDLRAFPTVARQQAGYQLYLVQAGLEPTDWKPMTNVGADCPRRSGCAATIGDAVYVLHCFEKKSQRTTKADLDLGKARYKQVQILVKEAKT